MRAVVAALGVAALVAGCGGDGSSSQTEDTSAATTPVPPATTAAPSTSATMVEPTTTVVVATTDEPTTTAAAEPMAELTVLRPDGIGEVDFGTAADEALAGLSSLFGPPDRVETIDPLGPGGDGCVEGATWLQCLVSRRVVDSGRLAVWEAHGLEAAMVDTTAYGREATMAEHFGDWHATVPADGTRLTTDEGLYPGMTVGELRQALPWVEFHYNEGLLDSFYVDLGDRGGYWGRLDWDPTTSDIEWGDVAAVQSALNSHGADLEVDGVWGPLTEAAWTEFLSGQDIEPVPPQLWLTPEIGSALGLPPDDITLATIEPRPTAEGAAPQPTAPAISPDALLRTNGLGPHDFGTEMSVVMSWATDLFGVPAVAGTPGTSPSGPAVSAVPSNLMYICGDQVAAHWETAALDLYFAQWEFDDDGLVSCDGPVRLVAWGVGSHLGVGTTTDPSSPRLTTEEGIGVGTTVAELIELDADPTFMQWSDSGVFPAGFYLGDPTRYEHVFGVLAWEWVRDLQAALNDDGYQLAVDGVAGPRTRAALESYRIERGLESRDDAILDLALKPSSDVQITSIASGHWPLEFECGTLELVGWHTPC